jgi:hypothetical protein
MWRGWVWLLCAGIVASFVGCTAAAQRAPAPSSNLTGVWIGNFTLGCVPPRAGPHCLVRQDISFTSFSMKPPLVGSTDARLRTIPA